MSIHQSEIAPGVPRKAVRASLIIIPVMAFKPPFVPAAVDGSDEVVQPTLVYVDDRGNERQIPTTANLWRAVDGNPGVGRRAQGFDGKDGRRRYWLYADSAGPNQKAVSFADFPHPDFLYSRATGVPENSPEDLLLQVDFATGSVRVLQVPVGARVGQIEAVVRAIDAVDHLESGQLLSAGVEVLSVSGNRITCSLPIAEDRGVGRSMMPG